MRKSIFIPLLCIVSNCVYAQSEKPREIKSQIHDVMVYMSGAELHHTATVRLTEGKQELIFKGLSSQLQEQTLIVDVEKKDVTILSVSSRVNYMDPVKNNDRIAKVKDSLAIVASKWDLYDSRIITLQKEKELLFKNEAIGGVTNGVAVAEIAKAADFYRQRMFDLEDELTRYRNLRSNSYLSKLQLENQLNNLNATFNPPTSEVSIVLMSPTATETDFSIKYQIPDAGWSPKYDVRSEGITKPIELTYRANIYNNSGSDWNSVLIKLSTADPKRGAEKPNLESWDLGEVELEDKNQMNNSQGFVSFELEEKKLQEVMITDFKQKPLSKKEDRLTPIDIEIIEVSELSAEFEIAQRYTILADAKPYIVEVSKHQLTAKYEHFAVPKMDVDAFLVAKISGWNALNLVSGKASVYYSGTYLGDSYINTASVEDTLILSMGRDKKISIARNKKTEASKKSISGNYVKESFVFETTLKNNREVPVLVTMEDQLPISSDKEIQVTEEELSGGQLDKYSGKIIYTISLQPGESKKLILAYAVKSPKNRTIRGSRHVRRSRAKM